MSIYISKRSLEQLEYDKIADLVKGYCKGEGAKASLEGIRFEDDIERLQTTLSQVNDVKTMITEQVSLSLYEYSDITEDLYMLSKEGYVLEAESVIKILHVLRNYQEFVNHFRKGRAQEYAHFYNLGKLENYNPLPIKLIDKVFDEYGDVRPSASAELTRIFKRIESLSREIDKKFDEIVKRYKGTNMLTDTAESLRSGRRVLILPAENKRKVDGIIHDQSATGKTVYLEPQEIMSYNNELYSLENEKRSEVYRILRTLSGEIANHRPMIADVYERLIDIDVIRAKGVFSAQIDGIMPALSADPVLQLKEARHPILVLQESSSNVKTIAFDLHLHGDNRLLLISGPNAGGKSVTLKAVGLIHLMIYSGLLVPIHKDSVIGSFGAIFTDIGDQQSIDEGLSTYSSHLHNLKTILDKSNKKSLILLDEIGSGTDPKLGGAIAEGVLDSLVFKKVFGIVTTHYSQLKLYAFNKKGVVNGAMLFDKENLSPTYKLKVGKPGSSYAFEVAKKVGLSHHVLKYARKKVGKQENQIEDLLVDLQDGKVVLDEQLAYIARERKQLDGLIKSYHEMSKQYEVKRKKLQIKAKEIEYKKANDENLQLQQLINKLEKEKNIDKVRELKEKARNKRTVQSTTITDLKKDVIAEKDPNEVIRPGNYVKMLDGDLSGEVISIQGNKATVLFGIMQMEVALSDVRLANVQLNIKRHKDINYQGVAFENNFDSKLDIRGYTLTDAEATLEVFFDKALLNNVRNLEIVHGKGKGTLRKLVIRKMKEYRDFTSYHHPPDERGGDGVTFVKV